ncbi:MAG: ABC transporter permease subunit [Treponema sp.]|jgi:putative aldouronate transport system permease protein|nr:ABC transporter permease subunit [Treponema sp.]
MKKKFVYTLPFYLMLLPAMVLLFIYNYIPMIGNLMAFERFNAVRGLFKSQWIGFDNFRYVFSMPDTPQVLWNTFYIAFLKVVTGIIIPVFFALLINEVGSVFYKRLIQTIIYFPHFLSWVILAGILIDVLSPSQGVIGRFFTFVGLKPIFFLGDPKVFPYTLVFTESWKEFGFGTIVYLAALTGIDPNLYEAAMIDGANRWQQTFYVTIPGILPIVMLMTILSMGNILNAGFDQVFNLYSPQVYKTGDILDTLVYRMGLIDAQYGVATAVGLFKSLISFVMLAVSYTLAYRFTDYRVF